MSPSSESDNGKQLKLISVPFKEASIDSPSFRAYVNFFHTRVEAFDAWIIKTMDFVDKKYTNSFLDCLGAKELLMTQLLPSPSMISNGVITNQSYTPLLLEKYSKEDHDFIVTMMKNALGDGTKYSSRLAKILTSTIHLYKKIRQSFEQLQKQYDDTLKNEQEIKISSTDVNPSKLKKSALEVYEIKKQYLNISLELLEMISSVKLEVDKFTVSVIDDFNINSKFMINSTGEEVDLAPKITQYFKDHQRWMENAIKGAESLATDIKYAKKQIYQYTLDHCKPSEDLADYNITALNSDTLNSSKLDKVHLKRAPEKSGWLYVKTTVGKSARKVWVRRWCFIENSVFGMFCLSPTKTYVEETDKFGVLLLKVRYDPDEGRKFCFELRTIGHGSNSNDNNNELSLVLQADSLKELKSWLKIFHLAQKYIMNLSQDSFEYDVACKRHYPEFFEFACSSTTSTDMKITTSDPSTRPLLDVLQGKYSEYDCLTFEDEKMFHFRMENTPITTRATQLAIFAHFYHQSNWLPSAIVANIWGTTNWSAYSVIGSELILQSINENASEAELSDKYYTNKMKIDELQFKSIFFSLDQRVLRYPTKLLLFKFSSFWCPNKKQRFAAKCYVTEDDVFCFMNTMGFICLLRKKLIDIDMIEIDKDDPNLFHIHYIESPKLSFYVYFTDPKIVYAKLKFLIANKKSSHPKKKEELHKIVAKIEINVKDSENKVKKALNKIESQKSASNPVDAEIPNTFWTMSEKGFHMLIQTKNYQVSSTVNYHSNHDIASKGLTHILFGDKSDAFPVSLYLAQKINSRFNNWTWHEEVNEKTNEKQLVRHINFQLSLTDNFVSGDFRRKDTEQNKRSVTQRIVSLIENRYYEIEQDPVFIKFPLCHIMRIKVKYVITEPYDPEHQIASKLHMSTSRSLLNVYYTIDYLTSADGEPINKTFLIEKIIKRLVISFTQCEFSLLRKVIKYYLERIGKHGKVIKAIKLCGTFEATPIKETKSPTNNTPLAHYTFSLLLRVLLKVTIYYVANVILILTRLLFNFSSMMARSLSKVNRILISLLFVSFVINIFLSGKTEISYWSTKRADKLYNQFADGKYTNEMQRYIAVKDKEFLQTSSQANDTNSALQKYYKVQELETDLDVDTQFTEARKNIASQRNKILVELNLLQNMERELVHDDYKTFLLKEIDLCNEFSSRENPIDKKQLANKNKYCNDCNQELARLSSLLL